MRRYSFVPSTPAADTASRFSLSFSSPPLDCRTPPFFPRPLAPAVTALVREGCPSQPSVYQGKRLHMRVRTRGQRISYCYFTSGKRASKTVVSLNVFAAVLTSARDLSPSPGRPRTFPLSSSPRHRALDEHEKKKRCKFCIRDK